MSKPWTPTKRRKRVRLACKRKVAYENPDDALSSMNEVIELGKSGDNTCEVYQCPICNQYHWGHVGRYPIPDLRATE